MTDYANIIFVIKSHGEELVNVATTVLSLEIRKTNWIVRFILGF